MKRIVVISLIAMLLLALSATVASAQGPSPNATYMGMETCAMCHPQVAESVNQTLHPWKLRPKDEANIVADWTVGEDVRTTTIEGETRAFTADDVDYVIGASGRGWKQRFIKVIDGVWRILPAQWNIATKEWVPYHADSWMEHDYKKSCVGCHTTGFDPATQEFKDFGVTCEACHGPGSEHVAGGGDKTKIVKDLSGNVCARCHVRGKSPEGYGWPEGYLPGDAGHYTDYYNADTSEKRWWMDGNEAWPQGHAKSHHQQYMEWENSAHARALDDLIASGHAQDFCLKCHSEDARRLEGVTVDTAQFSITCTTCHDPHGSDQPRGLIQEAYDTCVQCHNGGTQGGTQPIEAGATVHHPMQEMFEGVGALGVEGTSSPHFSAASGPICTSCHFVKTAKSAVPGDITSHWLKPIEPGEAVEGEPDSCTGCHTGQGEALQATIESRQSEIKAGLEELKTLLEQTKDEKGETDAWKTAYTNSTFVEADGSFGVHNYPYAKAILAASKDMLAAPEALPITGGELLGLLPIVAGGGLLLAGAWLFARKRG